MPFALHSYAASRAAAVRLHPQRLLQELLRRRRPVTASPAATAPMPPAPLDESLATLYLLAASTWQDIYDENYTLSFDVISGTMTEENTALKTKTVYRISVDDGKLFAWAEESGERKQLPFTLEDEVLTIDYGDPLGVITYAVAGKMP